MIHPFDAQRPAPGSAAPARSRLLIASAGLLAFAALSILALAPTVGRAAPSQSPGLRPMQQGVNASGIITNGQGTCFPDAVLVDCNGTVLRQLKGPGGAAFFSAYLNQWVNLNGAETQCVSGGSYIDVVTMQVAANPCPNGTQQATATAVPPGATATPVPPGATAVPGAPANLALGKAIRASTSQAGFPPEQAIDGNQNTWWASNAGRDWRYPARNPQWIYIDLGSPQQIQTLRIHWGTQRHARTYELYIWHESCRGWCFGGGTNAGDGGMDEWTAARNFETQYVMINLISPYLGGAHYEIKEWELFGGAAGAAAANSAQGKVASALTSDPAFPVGNATDGNVATEWHSAAGLPTWFYVDLGADTRMNRIILRWAAGLHATQYTLYAWNGRDWAPFHTQRAGAGGDETVNFWSLRSRYILLYANAGVAASIGLKEFEVYDGSSGGTGGTPGLPTPPAPPPPPIPLRLEGAPAGLSQPVGATRPNVRPVGAAQSRGFGQAPALGLDRLPAPQPLAPDID